MIVGKERCEQKSWIYSSGICFKNSKQEENNMKNNVDYDQFKGKWQENALLAWDTINLLPTKGIPVGGINNMQWSHLESFSSNPSGSYPKDPVRVYKEFLLSIGNCFVDQWIPENPLSIKEKGYDADFERGSNTGGEKIIRDGMLIDSPEAVVEHMEKYGFRRMEEHKLYLKNNFEEEVCKRIADEVEVQRLFGMKMLKGPYSGYGLLPYLQSFPVASRRRREPLKNYLRDKRRICLRNSLTSPEIAV